MQHTKPIARRWSLAPIILPTVLLTAVGCAKEPGAGDTATPATDTIPAGRPVDARLERVGIERLHRGEQSGFTESARIVARTQAELEDAWRRVHAGASPVPGTPSVDFRNAMVIVAALGERRTGGFEIAVDSVVRKEEGLVAHVTSTRPAESCMVTMVITYPVDVVRVDATAAQVDFQEREATRDC